MSAVNGTDRVTNKQLYDELSKIPSRTELRLTVVAALVLGQVAARVDLASSPTPVGFILRFFSLVF